VSAISGARSLNGGWNPDLPAGLDEGTDVIDPRAFVEIHSEEPARLIGEERIDAHDVSTRQMADYGRVVKWNECLVRAIAAFDLR
jgi:hypothetical protein